MSAYGAEDIVRIASSGVMGVSTLFIVATLMRRSPPAAAALWAAVVVILLATVVQLGTQYMTLRVTAHDRISVALSPDPKEYGHFLPNYNGGTLLARPRLWLSHGEPRCNPHNPEYDGTASCLTFEQAFFLNDHEDTINVSVDDALLELRERVSKLSAINSANAILRLEHSNGPRKIAAGHAKAFGSEQR
ncbi:MAG: hypothetical protein ACRD3Q_07155 [Terriglobales bacterium]